MKKRFLIIVANGQVVEQDNIQIALNPNLRGVSDADQARVVEFLQNARPGVKIEVGEVVIVRLSNE